MKLCGMRFTTVEVWVFASVYLLLNYILFRVRTPPEVAMRPMRASRMVLASPPSGWALVEGLNNPNNPNNPNNGSIGVQIEAHSVVEPPKDQVSTEKKDPNRIRTILLWNKLGESADFHFGIGQGPFISAKCPITNCQTTRDTSMLNQADAILFHGPEIKSFPQSRPHGQLYVYLQEEPRYNVSAKLLPHYRNRFNLTVSHRHDSDIVLPPARIIHDPSRKGGHAPFVNLKKRPKDVAWIASHCTTMSKREMYVRELRKYIDVDVFGKCGKKKCRKGGVMHCLSDIVKEYKYYLAFEKSYCVDFAKKFYSPLSLNIVPVVFGGANYSHVAPPHSLISVADYKSPKDLAVTLKGLARHEKDYNKYFEWKTKGYRIDELQKSLLSDVFCKMCEILNNPTYSFKDYRHLASWWLTGMCDSDKMLKMKHKW